MNSPLPTPEPREASPLPDLAPQLSLWSSVVAQNTPTSALSSADLTSSFANLSGLRQSIERHREEALAGSQQGGAANPALGGFVGRALAQVLQDYADDSFQTEHGFSEQPDLDTDRISIAGSSMVSSLEDLIINDSALQQPISAKQGLHKSADPGQGTQQQLEQDSGQELHDKCPPESPAAMNAQVTTVRAEQQSEQRSAASGASGKAQGSISFADGFGGGRTGSRSGHSLRAWGQDEDSVSFGPNLICDETLAGTPSVAFGRDMGVSQQTGGQAATANEAEGAAEANETPAPSSIGSVQLPPSSSRHSLVPADAIRSISLNPSPPARWPTGNRDSFWARASVSFRQAHGLVHPSAAATGPSSSTYSSAPLHANMQQEAQVKGQALLHRDAEEEDADLVVYDSNTAMHLSGESPPLSINLQRIFDDAMAHVDSAEVSPMPTCHDPGHVMSLVEQELLDMINTGPINADSPAARSPGEGSSTEAAGISSTVSSGKGNAEGGQSPSSQELSSASLQHMTASPHMTASSSHVLLRENPLSAAGSLGDDEDSNGDSPALLTLGVSRRSLQDELALAAALGPGIQHGDSLNPFSVQPDQGHLLYSSVDGKTREILLKCTGRGICQSDAWTSKIVCHNATDWVDQVYRISRLMLIHVPWCVSRRGTEPPA